MFPFVSDHFHTAGKRHRHRNMEFVSSLKEFEENFANRFCGRQWLKGVDFSKFAIIEGSILNSLCRTPFADTNDQRVNLLYCADNYQGFTEAVTIMISRLRVLERNCMDVAISIDRVRDGTSAVALPLSNVTLEVRKVTLNNSINPLSYSLHNLHIDIIQVAFIGKF